MDFDLEVGEDGEGDDDDRDGDVEYELSRRLRAQTAPPRKAVSEKDVVEHLMRLFDVATGHVIGLGAVGPA